MTYCTVQDMIDRFGEDELIGLTDRMNAGMIDDGVMARAIADATAAIDGYLAGRYQLPIDAVPPVVLRVACDIARYYLHDKAATEEVRNRYKDATALLTAVAQGRVTLGLPAGSEPASSATIDMQSGGRVFGRGSR